MAGQVARGKTFRIPGQEMQTTREIPPFRRLKEWTMP